MSMFAAANAELIEKMRSFIGPMIAQYEKSAHEKIGDIEDAWAKKMLAQIKLLRILEEQFN